MRVLAALGIGMLVYAFGWLFASSITIPIVIIGLIVESYYERNRHAGRAERMVNDASCSPDE